MQVCKPESVRYVVVLTKADKRGAKISDTIMEVRGWWWWWWCLVVVVIVILVVVA